MDRKSVFVVLLLVVFLVSAGSVSAKQITLTFTAGSAGGGWYGIAGGLAPIIKEYDPELHFGSGKVIYLENTPSPVSRSNSQTETLQIILTEE